MGFARRLSERRASTYPVIFRSILLLRWPINEASYTAVSCALATTYATTRLRGVHLSFRRYDKGYGGSRKSAGLLGSDRLVGRILSSFIVLSSFGRANYCELAVCRGDRVFILATIVVRNRNYNGTHPDRRLLRGASPGKTSPNISHPGLIFDAYRVASFLMQLYRSVNIPYAAVPIYFDRPANLCIKSSRKYFCRELRARFELTTY